MILIYNVEWGRVSSSKLGKEYFQQFRVEASWPLKRKKKSNKGKVGGHGGWCNKRKERKMVESECCGAV